jgi:hypothetical protein
VKEKYFFSYSEQLRTPKLGGSELGGHIGLFLVLTKKSWMPAFAGMTSAALFFK